jgi:cytochrome c-type biogenesis protein CcmH
MMYVDSSKLARQFFGRAWLAVALAMVLATLMLLLVAPAARAQEPTPIPGLAQISDDQVNAIAKQMYCPVCENTPLDVCPTQACTEWRELIREMLAQGKNEAEIKQYFVDRFGDRVLAAPPARGLNWLAYIIPPAIILAGVFLLFSAFRAWKQAAPVAPAPPAPPPGAPPADDYVRRLEEELKKQ